MAAWNVGGEPCFPALFLWPRHSPRSSLPRKNCSMLRIHSYHNCCDIGVSWEVTLNIFFAIIENWSLNHEKSKRISIRYNDARFFWSVSTLCWLKLSMQYQGMYLYFLEFEKWKTKWKMKYIPGSGFPGFMFSCARAAWKEHIQKLKEFLQTFKIRNILGANYMYFL